MKKRTMLLCRMAIAGLCFVVAPVPEVSAGNHQAPAAAYMELVDLHNHLRTLERPATPSGVPDYSAASLEKVRAGLIQCRSRYAAIDTTGWPVDWKVDHALVRAEMNGLDFDLTVLQPWARDPAYYAIVWAEQSDTPSHEGPVCHGAIELWTYAFPLAPADADRLAAQLRIIPPLLQQARTNLTGDARDLWIAGISSIRSQAADLEELARRAGRAGPQFTHALQEARSATLRFAGWLEEEAPSRTGPSGVGKDNYTWFLRNVLLVPLTWEEEVTLLTRELGRAYASLHAERERNRDLPPLSPASTPAEYNERADRSMTHLIAFLRQSPILPVSDTMERELRKHPHSYQPEERRNFFLRIMHLDPTPLYTHGIHWFDIARQNTDPHASPIRRDPLPYNIWVSRSEGLTTNVEEMFMHAGLYDNSPRSRELVWIMLAQRCARGLASLFVHANEMTLQGARDYQVTWTPHGWTGDVSLVGFEQHLYLRQPGYGPSYVTGKHLIDRLLMDLSIQMGDGFQLLHFFDDVTSAGMIPVSLIQWQLTGMDDEIRAITGHESGEARR